MSQMLGGGGSGSGADNFLDLTDTPDSYASQALKLVRVNAGETAVEFVAASSLSGINADTLDSLDSTAFVLKSLVDAKGDLITATANDTPARLAVGTNNQVLIANSATATGLEWTASLVGVGLSDGAINTSDVNFEIYDNIDPTKAFGFQANQITTGTTRTLTIPDASGTIALLTATQTFTNKTFSDTITSTLATGTSPLTVASTTKVANLNADLLDDQTGSFYLARANHTGTQLAATISDFSTSVIALLTDANIPNTITLDNITQITTRSHASLQNLTSADDHTQYALLAGRGVSQQLTGGTGSGNILLLESTSHATKGSVISMDNFIIGRAVDGLDYKLTFDGFSSDGVITWMEDEDQFRFEDVTSFYRNDTSTSPNAYIEQDSTGDACLSFLLTAGQEYRTYIDNSDSDSFKIDDQTGADTLVKYDPSTGTLNLGVIGDGTIGDGTERTWKPQTDLKINWGASANRFNEGWFAELYASANAVGDPVFTIKSAATNDDPTQICYQNRVATTDATVTTLHTFTVPTSTTYMITAYVVARRTGGASGAAEDGAGYVIRGLYKNTAGTVALIGAVSADFTAESQAGWDATFDVTGATVRIRVTGAASNNVTWNSTSYIWQVAS